MPKNDNQPQSEWRSTKFWLALGVTVISVVAVGLLAGLIIHNSKDQKDAAASAQNVLASVLPLLGTWVGTILAYYFSKENFEAATKSVTDLAKQISPQEKLKSALAKDKMIPQAKMFSVSMRDNSTLVEILKNLEKEKKGNRVPILGDNREPRYILHRSIIDKFISELIRKGKTNAEINALTLQDLLEQSAPAKTIAQSFGTMKPDDTLADAMNIMSKIDDCQDVFVTATGKKDEAVLGWITNVIIQDNAKV